MKHPQHDILIAIANGVPMEFKPAPTVKPNEWLTYNPNQGFTMGTDPSLWRIKPKEKVKKYQVLWAPINGGGAAVTVDYHTSLLEFSNKYPGAIPIQLIESTMEEFDAEE